MVERNILSKDRHEILFNIFFTVIFFCHQCFAQQAIYDIAKSYYRSNPFGIEFSKFLNHLINDPTLADKIIHKKTDSTLFYLKGVYASHSPFFFKANKTEVILAEQEEADNDSSQNIHTVFVYQLISHAQGEEGIKNVREEFERLCRHYKKKFDGNNYKELKADEKQTGEINNYSSNYPGYFPLTIA